MRLWIIISKILNGTQSSEMGLYDLGSSVGLFGFGRAMTEARRQVFGSFDLRKHDEKNAQSQPDVVVLWWVTNSGWMLSRPGDLPGLNLLMASLSSSAVKSPERLESTLSAPKMEDTSRDVSRAKSLSASGKRPFFRSWDAMASAVTGHLGGVVFLPVSWLMVCHSLRLEWVKSIDSTTSVHLVLRPLEQSCCSHGHLFSGASPLVVTQKTAALLVPTRDVVPVIATRNGLLCRTQEDPAMAKAGSGLVEVFQRAEKKVEGSLGSYSIRDCVGGPLAQCHSVRCCVFVTPVCVLTVEVLWQVQLLTGVTSQTALEWSAPAGRKLGVTLRPT
ncbi:hypothetical protein NQZ68_011261 [Dissostichus eleginoides]|nr:hypothetical protein NQZ68_011261 [Dissostichus eleginoides]